jgi:PIN domain nuclease of toxin-antitoxin system
VTHIADACALVDFLLEPLSTMTVESERALERSAQISSVTVWELTRKANLGKLRPLPSLDGSFARYLQQRGFGVLPLDWEDAEAANRLPPLHKDPMDRMLIAQALRRDLTVITDDRMFSAYGVRTVW